MRTPLPAVIGGVVIAALGVAGFVRGEMPVATSSGAPPAQPIVITDARVLPPLPPTHVAAAYFTITNTTSSPDRLLSVVSGAGETTVLHVTVNGAMRVPSDGVVIPAHGRLVLSVGQGHVMIENVFGTLKPGDNVNLSLTFEKAGTIDVNAPVVAR
jgi:copper(I)-binding protein